MESNIASESGSEVHTVMWSSTLDSPPAEPPPALALLPAPAESVGSSEFALDEHAAKVLSMAAATMPANARGLILRKVVLLARHEHSDRTVPLVET
jgi:hypothetical protein